MLNVTLLGAPPVIRMDPILIEAPAPQSDPSTTLFFIATGVLLVLVLLGQYVRSRRGRAEGLDSFRRAQEALREEDQRQ